MHIEVSAITLNKRDSHLYMQQASVCGDVDDNDRSRDRLERSALTPSMDR